MYLKQITKAALLGVSLAALAGAGASAKTLVYCSEGSPEGFDPGIYTAGTTSTRRRAPSTIAWSNSSTARPDSSRAWPKAGTVSDDGLEYTFHLRPGVKFQTTDFFTPTRDLNADDVVFSFERQLKADNPWNQYVAGAAWEYSAGMGFPDLIKSVEKVDDLTVKFVLTHPEAPFLADLAMDFASIMSKEYADKLEADGKKEQLNQKPLGTGPFEFVAYEPDAVIRYRAHEEYWAGKEKIDDLVFAITTDAAVRAQKLQAGECHIMPYPNAADVAGLEGNADLQVDEQEGLNVAYLAYNTLVPPFDKPEVRKALNMAINKQAIIDAVFQGAATPAKNPIPPTMWSYNDADRGRQLRSGSGEGGARGGRRDGLVDEGLGDAGLASLHAQRAARGGADPGGLRQDRRDRRDRLL